MVFNQLMKVHDEGSCKARAVMPPPTTDWDPVLDPKYGLDPDPEQTRLHYNACMTLTLTLTLTQYNSPKVGNDLEAAMAHGASTSEACLPFHCSPIALQQPSHRDPIAV